MLGNKILDNYDYFRAHEAALYDKIKNNPVCDECGEIVTDDYYYRFDSVNYCIDCLENHRETII